MTAWTEKGRVIRLSWLIAVAGIDKARDRRCVRIVCPAASSESAAAGTILEAYSLASNMPNGLFSFLPILITVLAWTLEPWYLLYGVHQAPAILRPGFQPYMVFLMGLKCSCKRSVTLRSWNRQARRGEHERLTSSQRQIGSMNAGFSSLAGVPAGSRNARYARNVGRSVRCVNQAGDAVVIVSTCLAPCITVKSDPGLWLDAGSAQSPG